MNKRVVRYSVDVIVDGSAPDEMELFDDLESLGYRVIEVSRDGDWNYDDYLEDYL